MHKSKMNDLKAKQLFNMLNTDIDFSYTSEKTKTTSNKNLNKLIYNEFNSKLITEKIKIDCVESLEGIGSVAWFFCNVHYNEMPSLIYKDMNFNTKLIQFLKENGKLMYRKISESENYPEIGYVFLYKNCYYTVGVCHTNSEDLLIHGIGIYHPLSIEVDYSEIKQFEVASKASPKIGIIKTSRFGPAVTWLDHKTDLKFKFDNYNEDFNDFFHDMKEKITGENKTGLYLLYGEAGTGKSSAIRHLISEIDRPVVYIPPQMINCLSSPEFTDLVTNSLKGSILVIEDAEKALMKRETEDGFFNSELVSSILNLTDGLYADLSQTSIIATYNCNRNLVDSALLRKGRLRSEYHFTKLTLDRTQKLMDDLGHNIEVNEPMSLADIYNYEQQYTNKKEEKKRSVGFGG